MGKKNLLFRLISIHLLLNINIVNASFDLFIDAEESEKLLGVRTQSDNDGDSTEGGIYYVRNGVKNDYALTNADNQV